MNLAIIGSGGREHAICYKLKQSRKIKSLICIPGNAGTKKIAKNINISLSDHQSILDFVIEKNIYVTIVGPEGPLDEGIVDYFRLNNQNIFGPNKIASQL